MAKKRRPNQFSAAAKGGDGANWIKGAVHPSRKGEFTAKAKASGMSVGAYAKKMLGKRSHASTRTKQQANFAQRMQEMHGGHHRR